MRFNFQVDVPEGECGTARVERFDVQSQSIEGIRQLLAGRPVMDGTYTKLIVNGQLWMSDTPAEWSDHFEAVHQIRRRGGRVLINGLGLGMVVRAALAVPEVTHVDVIESNEDVIKLVGPTYEGERCTIHHADAFEMLAEWPRGTRWTVAWHDIWLDIDENNLPDMAALKRSYGRRVDWQGAWGQDTILRMRRQNQGW